jgi:hypothetical protein
VTKSGVAKSNPREALELTLVLSRGVRPFGPCLAPAQLPSNWQLPFAHAAHFAIKPKYSARWTAELLD